MNSPVLMPWKMGSSTRIAPSSSSMGGLKPILAFSCAIGWGDSSLILEGVSECL